MIGSTVLYLQRKRGGKIKKIICDMLELDREKKNLKFIYKNEVVHVLSVEKICDIIGLKVTYDDVTLCLQMGLSLWQKNERVELLDIQSIVFFMKSKLNIELDIIDDFSGSECDTVSVARAEDEFIINGELYTPKNFGDELDGKNN